MRSLIYIERMFNRFSDFLGWLSSILFILLLLNVVYDVVMRYAFNDVSIAMQELEWHLFSAVFLLGIPYAIRENSHVRVDILYDRWPLKTQALINLCGAIIFVLPFAILVTYYSVSFAFDAFQMGEGSGDPGGLPARWLIKSLIPFSFMMIAFASFGMITTAMLQIKQPEDAPDLSNKNLL
mgnify:CR=1 FL=1